MSAGDDGLHSDVDAVVNGGTIGITRSYEGLEGGTVTITAGDVSIVASDDGVNASGTNGNATSDQQQGRSSIGQQADASASMPQQVVANDIGTNGPAASGGTLTQGDTTQQPPQQGWQQQGGGGMDSDDTAEFTISGGSLVIDADGDGIDSNGTIVISGGVTYVSGPTNDGNSPIDYGTSATITGGTLIAAGSSGMFEDMSSDSTQAVATVFLNASTTGGISLVDTYGTVIASFSPSKEYECVTISSTDMASDGSYVLTTGSTSTDVTMTGTVTDVGTKASGGMGAGQQPTGRASQQRDVTSA